jgi:hypothetical protein
MGWELWDREVPKNEGNIWETYRKHMRKGVKHSGIYGALLKNLWENN